METQEARQTPTEVHNDSVNRVRDLIDDSKIAVLTTVDQRGQMHCQPMYTQQSGFDGDLWFLTSRSSSLVAEFRENASVFVQYAHPDAPRFVIIVGTGTIVHDQAKIDELWNPALNVWFKSGPDDSDIALVKIESHRAEYWHSPATPVRWFQFLAGVATGKHPAGDTHGSVDL